MKHISRLDEPVLVYEQFVDDLRIDLRDRALATNPFAIVAHVTGRHVNDWWVRMTLLAKGADTIDVYNDRCRCGRTFRFESRFIQTPLPPVEEKFPQIECSFESRWNN